MTQLPLDGETRNQILEATYDLGMFKVDFEDGYELTSGGTSPLYIDGRLWTQDPDVASRFASALAEGVQKSSLEYDVIGGGVTAGVPYAERLAHELGAPSIYVRDEPKGYGRAAQIEGREDLSGDTVLLVEDLITNGGSKMEFLEGIERAGGKVEDCIAFYDREQGGEEFLAEHEVQLHSAMTLTDLMEYGCEEGHITEQEYMQLNDYLADEL